MTRWDAFRALCGARFLEFFREPEVVFWSFVFPIILSVGLGVAFRNRPVETSPVAVVEGPTTEALAASLRANKVILVSAVSGAEAASALRMGRVDLVILRDSEGVVEYRYDPSRPESVLARARVDDTLQRAAGRGDPVKSRDLEVSEAGGRYIDFLIPGIIGMNLMSGGMWGVGFTLVDMRIKRLLKRLLATPMRKPDFVLSLMTVRIVAMAIEMTFVLLFGHWAFGVPVRGSVLSILALGALGALTFGGMGLLVASRARRIEGVMGLMNIVMMPMFVCSGVFFSSERFPAAVQPLIRILPLTAVNDALRAVVLEGASLASQSGRLSVLVAWALAGFLAGLRLFIWN